MGSEMAYNLFSRKLVESHGTMRFVVCDAREATSAAFAHNFTTQFPGARIEIANTPAEYVCPLPNFGSHTTCVIDTILFFCVSYRAVMDSSTVVTMLPSSPHVRNVYVEEDGIIPALKTLSQEAVASTLCIDSTTLDVEVARNVAAQVTSVGASMVDAPVSGGVSGAKAATLSFLVGGAKPAFRLASPLLTHMGQRVIYCGESGAGLVAKICNNLILGVQQIVVAESMLLGQKLGLDPKVLASVINSSTGACWSSSVNNPVPGALTDKSPPCERDYEGGFATSLMLKVCTPRTPYRGAHLVCCSGHGAGDGPGRCERVPVVDGDVGGENVCGRCERGPRVSEQGLLVCVPVSARVPAVRARRVVNTSLSVRAHWKQGARPVVPGRYGRLWLNQESDCVWTLSPRENYQSPSRALSELSFPSSTSSPLSPPSPQTASSPVLLIVCDSHLPRPEQPQPGRLPR